MNNQQKSCLKLLDELVENGVDITDLPNELPRDTYHSVRKRMYRAFGSGDEARKAFGLYDVNGIPYEYELYRCFYIDDLYEVKLNPFEQKHLCDVYYLNQKDFDILSRPIIVELRKDALDEFYRNEFPDKIKSTVVEKGEYSHIWNYIRQIYGNIGNMMEFYGTPSDIFVDYDYGRYNGDSIKKGHVFEKLVEQILKVVYERVNTQVSFDRCRPDFVIGGEWFDAKLSRFSPYHPRSTMLYRYLKYTEGLTIIYAKDKRGPYVDEIVNVKFIHISEYFPELEKAGRRDLIDRCKTFLKALDDKGAIS